MWLFKLCSQKFNPIKRFCSKSELLIFNDTGKMLSKFLPNAKFGPVRPKELCVFFLCVFPLLLLLLLFFNSSPDLNFCLYSNYIYLNFRFKNTKFSASDRAHVPLRHPLCHVCKRAIDADAPPNSPPPHSRRRVYSRAALCSFGVLAVVNFLVDDDELWNSLSL